MPEEKTIQQLAATAESSMRGTSGTVYALEPILFIKEIVDAAQKLMYFRQIAKTFIAPKGTKDIIVPYRSVFLGSSGVTFDTTTPTAGGADISFTTINNLDGITITPAPVYCGAALENYGLKVNSLDFVEAAKEELTYALADRIDQAIRTALIASANQSTSSARGSQIVYGGDARRDSELVAGDVITPSMISEAIRKLQSTANKYWPATAGAEADSSQSKNPWINVQNEPFVLFIAPEQEDILRNDSQFSNAAEYGGREVILNGEIGKLYGVKILVTNNVPSYATSVSSPDGESAANPGVAMHRCLMVKSQKAVAIGFLESETPEMEMYPYQNRDETRITLISTYQAKAIYKDAIVFLDVSQA